MLMTPRLRIFLQRHSYDNNVYAGELEVRPPGAPTTGSDREVPGLSHPTLTFAPGRSVRGRDGASVRGTRFFEQSCSVPPLKAILEGDG
jgi:hypothetical protein